MANLSKLALAAKMTDVGSESGEDDDGEGQLDGPTQARAVEVCNLASGGQQTDRDVAAAKVDGRAAAKAWRSFFGPQASKADANDCPARPVDGTTAATTKEVVDVATDGHDAVEGDGAADDEDQLYCVCQREYDDSRPMVACDHCDEWYHYDCIGLAACDMHCDCLVENDFSRVVKMAHEAQKAGAAGAGSTLPMRRHINTASEFKCFRCRQLEASGTTKGAGVLPCELLIGCRVRVLWEHDKWFTGTVTG